MLTQASLKENILMSVYSRSIYPILLLLIFSCGNSQSQVELKPESLTHIHTEGNTLGTRFSAPSRYSIYPCASTSFAQNLRNLPLKKSGEPVLLYDGTLKSNQNAHIAVVDLPIGNKNLHQCADAIMRLRADYLFQNKNYDNIHFNFTNGFNAKYSQWRKGKRIRISGNKSEWYSGGHNTVDSESYWEYLEMVWSFAGTLSLSRELVSREFSNMQIGDVLIQGGSPGHAVLVVNMAKDSLGNRLYMLAQSYMPAQEIHILRNLSDPQLSPWYTLDEENIIKTPEWSFTPQDLKYFKE